VGGYAAHAVIVIGFALFPRDIAVNNPRVDGYADSASPSTLCLILPTFPEGQQHDFPQPSIMGGV